MSTINKPGILVQLPDGRIGTTVYNGLDGVGIKWGRHNVRLEDFGGMTPLFSNGEEPPEDFDLYPDAILRAPYNGGDPNLEYVGEDFEIITKADKNEKGAEV